LKIIFLKRKWILLVCAGLVVISAIVLSIRKSIEISWPTTLIQTNEEYISGKLVNFSPDAYSKLEIKLFVHPDDTSKMYWLNDTQSKKIKNNGDWYQMCRFGDEDTRIHRMPLPFDFYVYAVVVSQGTTFPFVSENRPFEAASEEDFIKKIQPFAKTISKRFVVTRIEPKEDLTRPIVMHVTSPVKLSWSENVPMYLEFYHKGSIIRESMYKPGQYHDLPSSSELYEIKLSKSKNFPKSNVLIMVEDAPRPN
jgi:hypothetical protein